ncbi:MAG: hypothetical protein ACOC5E_02840, partial [Acidobacteriota bacterium]
MSSRTWWIGVGIAGGMLLVLGVTPHVAAQKADYDVDGAIECFRVKTLSIENECAPGILAANGVTERPSAYPPDVVEGVLDGLLDLALSAREQRVRT